MKRVHLISNMVILRACLFSLQLVLILCCLWLGEVGKISMSCKRKFRELKLPLKKFKKSSCEKIQNQHDMAQSGCVINCLHI